jgi:hypothetical protein
MKGRVIIIVHCTPPEWDLCTYEVSCWYLKGFLSYVLDKNYFCKITKGNNSKIIQGRVIILVQSTPPQWGQPTYDVSSWYLKYFLRYAPDKNVRRKDGRTEGRAETISISPPFRRGIKISATVFQYVFANCNWQEFSKKISRTV